MDVDALKLDGDACGGRLEALALWIVGRLLISFALRLLGRTFSSNSTSASPAIQTALKIVLNIALVVAVLGFFGVEPPRLPHCSPLAASPSASRGAPARQLRGRCLLVFLRPFRSAIL